MPINPLVSHHGRQALFSFFSSLNVLSYKKIYN
jgi:hypothetical protein